jgi:hypothetical protein
MLLLKLRLFQQLPLLGLLFVQLFHFCSEQAGRCFPCRLLSFGDCMNDSASGGNDHKNKLACLLLIQFCRL